MHFGQINTVPLLTIVHSCRRQVKLSLLVEYNNLRIKKRNWRALFLSLELKSIVHHMIPITYVLKSKMEAVHIILCVCNDGFRITSLKIFKHYKLKPSFSIIKDSKAKDKVRVGDKPPPQVSTIWSSLIQFDQVWWGLIIFDSIWSY